MQNLQALFTTLLLVYTDGRAALADGKINSGELFKLIMDAAQAATIDWKALPNEWDGATTQDQFALINKAETELANDPNKDTIIGIVMMALAAGKLKK